MNFSSYFEIMNLSAISINKRMQRKSRLLPTDLAAFVISLYKSMAKSNFRQPSYVLASEKQSRNPNDRSQRSKNDVYTESE
jgi:hypothetical protein